jgi:hypothetical protein
MKKIINPSLLPETLYEKSRVYIRRGFRAQSAGDNEEYQLWASLSLELLGKAALSRVHPALVADPNHYQSLFAACGKEITPDIRTITAKTLFVRLGHLDKGFDLRHQQVCEQMTLRRNAELHSGESPFSGMPAEGWERGFWGAIVLILGIQDETLDSWLGAEEAKVPAEIIKQAEHALQWAVKNRIRHCTEDFESKHRDQTQRAKLLSDSEFLHWNDWSWDERERTTCPACKAQGFLGGNLWDEEVIASEPGWGGVDENGEYYGEAPSDTVRKTYTVEIFECLVCKLTLFGANEVAAGGLNQEFSSEEKHERNFYDDYGND